MNNFDNRLRRRSGAFQTTSPFLSRHLMPVCTVIFTYLLLLHNDVMIFVAAAGSACDRKNENCCLILANILKPQLQSCNEVHI